MRIALIIILSFSLLLECCLTVFSFVQPRWLHSALNGNAGDFSLPTIRVISWFLLLVTLLIGLNIWLVAREEKSGELLSGLLAIWWIGIGIALTNYGIRGNLLTDTAKGVVILVLVILIRSGFN